MRHLKQALRLRISPTNFRRSWEKQARFLGFVTPSSEKEVQPGTAATAGLFLEFEGWLETVLCIVAVL